LKKNPVFCIRILSTDRRTDEQIDSSDA